MLPGMFTEAVPVDPVSPVAPSVAAASIWLNGDDDDEPVVALGCTGAAPNRAWISLIRALMSATASVIVTETAAPALRGGRSGPRRCRRSRGRPGGPARPRARPGGARQGAPAPTLPERPGSTSVASRRPRVEPLRVAPLRASRRERPARAGNARP